MRSPSQFLGTADVLRRYLSIYLLVIAGFGAAIVGLLLFGMHWLQGGMATPAAAVADPPLGTALLQGLQKPLGMLLLQVVVIMAAARIAGTLAHRVGQPSVVGEILAGILLGPSLLGWWSREAMLFLFPEASLVSLKLLSYIGVLLFMFVVGMDLDAAHLGRKAPRAVVISHSAIVFPFFLGVCAALVLYATQAPAGVSVPAFALFMGIAMSITAFPVLARIIEERGLAGSELGNTAIACAAVDDVTAWCLLAVVLAIARSSGLGSALGTLGLALLFIAVMVFLLRPLVERIIQRAFEQRAGAEEKHRGLVTAVLVFVFVSAGFTEVIGIHALFGAFLAGVLIPVNTRFRVFLRGRVETLALLFLMPLFFAHTGLRTEIGLLQGWSDWLLCAALIGIAVAGKLLGAMLAARWTGMGWRDAFAIGALMNTRGLMELVVLNIGYDLGILSPRIFTMMVIMALVTTFMAGPLVSLAGLRRRAAVSG